jgi:transketolase
MSFAGSTVHIPSAFSIVEILSVLYSRHLDFKEDEITGFNRNSLVLSKGHGVMAQYACLRQAGLLKDSDLKNYFKDGSNLKGLSDSHVNGLDVTSGSLGHGLSVGTGIALGFKLSRSKHRVYALVGDGEMNEGPMWEALLFASHFKLDNLIIIVDKNGFQAMGMTDEIMALGNLKGKFEAFGFTVLEVDGHDLNELDEALNLLKGQVDGKPKAIIANTIKGKGVSFMENNNKWHYTRLDSTTYKDALREVGDQ